MTADKRKRIPLVTILLFTLAFGLLIFSSIGGTRAALIYGTEQNAYQAEIKMMSANLVLIENGHAVSGELLTGLPDANPIPGKSYEEVLAVVNNGSAEKGDIDEYIRVQVYKYWLKDDGETKDLTLDPALIELSAPLGGWIEDSSASTAERTVLYYSVPVAPGEATTPFCETITVSDEVMRTVKQTTIGPDADGRTTTITTFAYDGKLICLEVEADGVQTHHAEDAILSAWGRSVSLQGDAITLNDGGGQK